MRKIVVFFLVFAVFGMLSAWDEFNKYSIADELRKPGVKLVAVDFYATWCVPCNAAIPKWKKLQEKYGDKGFELIVVSVQSEGSCSQPPKWNPDKMVCDYDGEIADAWHANDLPQAFLWSWQGNLLVAHGGVDNVATAVENYFKKIPRVYVEEGSDKNIYQLVRSKLRENSKIEIVASDKERKALASMREKSYAGNYSDNMKCKLGEEVSANSRLVISTQKRGKKNALVLELFSVEKGCLTASGTATLRGNPEQEVAEAVFNLLKNLLGDVKMPSEGGRKVKPAFQTGRFGEESDDWEIGGGEETIVKFESNPAGAFVMADGNLLCQSTPCSKMLTKGNHQIEMQKENYVAVSQKQEIKEGKTVKFTLEPNFAWLSVTGNYAVSLRLDGQNIGEIPINERVINPGNHKIEHTDGCFYNLGEAFTVKRGEKKNIRLDLKYRESAIKVYAQDEKGNDIKADVFVDDKNVGRTPGSFKVPLCSKKLYVKKDKFIDYSVNLSLKEKQVETFQAKLKKTNQQHNKIGVKTDSKRDETIKNINELIKDYPEGPRKAGLYRRLAELYWEKATEIKAIIMDDYNKEVDNYYEMNDQNAPMPELNLNQAQEWNKKVVEICDYIIKKYPTYQGLDEIYFFMASNLTETGQTLSAVRYYTLVVEKFGNSKFVPDAYFEMGEYFFNNNNIFKAIPNYKAIIDKYPSHKFYGFALYKYAWCMYNVGEYEQAIEYFKQTVKFAQKINDPSLKEDALNDMVAPYAESGLIDAAEKYFKKSVREPKYFIATLKRLAQIYFDQERWKEAIKIYEKLLREAPKRDEAPTWREQIKECQKKLNM